MQIWMILTTGNNQDSFANLHGSTTGWYGGESHDVTEVDGDGRVALG